MSARIALLHILHMAAERGGAAVADRLEGFSLMSTEHMAPLREELFFVGAEDIGHFEPMIPHGFLERKNEPDRANPALSSGLSGGANGAVGEVQVACRGSEMRVPQQSLDHEQVHALVQQMRRESVAQRVGMNRLGDSGLLRRCHTKLRKRFPLLWDDPAFLPGKSQSVGRFHRQ